LYATSYTNAIGGLSAVITNKSATTHQVTIRVNGSAATRTFPLQFVSATDPSTANSAAAPNALTVQTAKSNP
jgi:alpha-L-arabinofuranosidase